MTEGDGCSSHREMTGKIEIMASSYLFECITSPNEDDIHKIRRDCNAQIFVKGKTAEHAAVYEI